MPLTIRQRQYRDRKRLLEANEERARLQSLMGQEHADAWFRRTMDAYRKQDEEAHQGHVERCRADAALWR